MHFYTVCLIRFFVRRNQTALRTLPETERSCSQKQTKITMRNRSAMRSLSRSVVPSSATERRRSGYAGLRTLSIHPFRAKRGERSEYLPTIDQKLFVNNAKHLAKTKMGEQKETKITKRNCSPPKKVPANVSIRREQSEPEFLIQAYALRDLRNTPSPRTDRAEPSNIMVLPPSGTVTVVSALRREPPVGMVNTSLIVSE